MQFIFIIHSFTEWFRLYITFTFTVSSHWGPITMLNKEILVVWATGKVKRQDVIEILKQRLFFPSVRSVKLVWLVCLRGFTECVGIVYRWLLCCGLSISFSLNWHFRHFLVADGWYFSLKWHRICTIYLPTWTSSSIVLLTGGVFNINAPKFCK